MEENEQIDAGEVNEQDREVGFDFDLLNRLLGHQFGDMDYEDCMAAITLRTAVKVMLPAFMKLVKCGGPTSDIEEWTGINQDSMDAEKLSQYLTLHNIWVQAVKDLRKVCKETPDQEVDGQEAAE